MLPQLPNTPEERGRSRFFKSLPTPPNGGAPQKSPASISPLRKFSLPPLPQKEMIAAAEIHRRAVPGKPSTSSSRSSDSDYSESPGLSRSGSSSDHERDSLSGIDSETGSPPIPPSKDKQANPSVDRPETPLNILSSLGAKFDSSPPRIELWRRRSEKSERSIVVTGLKLDKSNGLTASPPKRQERPAASDRGNLPRSFAGRKPVPLRAAPPQPDLSMGNKLGKEKKKGLDDISSDSVYHEATTQSYPAFQRLPTPEYIKTEENQSSKPPPFSPISTLGASNDKPPAVPSKSESRGTSSAAASKSSEASISSESTTRPTLVSPHSRQPSDTLTTRSEPPMVRSPQLQNPITSASVLTRPRSPHRRTPSLATDFPLSPSPIEDGAFLSGPPLDVTHFECFHFHKYMRNTKNTSCPMACMICQKEDTETRWRCTWCCLSACGSCMQVLTSIPGKDLKQCLEQIGN